MPAWLPSPVLKDGEGDSMIGWTGAERGSAGETVLVAVSQFEDERCGGIQCRVRERHSRYMKAENHQG